MIGKIILQALVIGLLSTGVYGVFTRSTRDPYQRGLQKHYLREQQRKEKIKEYLYIGTTVTSVTVILLLMTTNRSEALVSKAVESPAMNHKPPF